MTRGRKKVLIEGGCREGAGDEETADSRDESVRDMEVPELGPSSECNNEILILPIKAFTVFSCGHVFHRLCIERKHLHTSTV
ncbi:13596_t:CDS:2, partial [Funneliformis geosporum]